MPFEPSSNTTDPHDGSYWALRGLPPFPAVATRLLQILANDEFQTSELVKVFRADPMFASELLQAVNSARYGLKKEISSIQHAVTILGGDTLRSLGIALSLRIYLGPVIQQEVLARVWRHSLATAAICDLLERSSGGRASSSDTAYVAGLLHDIGCLGLMAIHPDTYANALVVSGGENRDLREVERTLFGIDHCEAGRSIARAWHFSSEIEEVALRHHDPVEGSETLIDLVRIAVLLADSLGWDIVPSSSRPGTDEVLKLLSPMTRQRLQFTPEELQELIHQKISGFLPKKGAPPAHRQSPKSFATR